MTNLHTRLEQLVETAVYVGDKKYPDNYDVVARLRDNQRQSLKEVEAHITEDLLELLPTPYPASGGYPDRQADGYNQAIAEVAANLAQYCSGGKENRDE